MGAFRDVQTWSLTTVNKSADPGKERVTLTLRAGQGAKTRSGRSCSPKEISSPNGQRLILIVTDCSSPGWYDGTIARQLCQWTAHNMVTVLQMLPEYLWESSALAEAIQVTLCSSKPGAINSQLDIDFPWYLTDSSPIKCPPIPVVTLEPESLNAWAHMVAGAASAQVTGVYLPLEPIPTFKEKDYIGEQNVTPEDKWRRFRTTASPIARELAGYLAAAPLSLPIMRLVQAAMLPMSHQVHLAEVLRSGLIKRVASYELAESADDVQYDFVEGVRELLITTVLLSDTRTSFRCRIPACQQTQFGTTELPCIGTGSECR